MVPVTLVPNNTLITDTPEEGRALAIKLSRLIIKATQPDEAARNKMRDVYANDPAMLVSICQYGSYRVCDHRSGQ